MVRSTDRGGTLTYSAWMLWCKAWQVFSVHTRETKNRSHSLVKTTEMIKGVGRARAGALFYKSIAACSQNDRPNTCPGERTQLQCRRVCIFSFSFSAVLLWSLGQNYCTDEKGTEANQLFLQLHTVCWRKNETFEFGDSVQSGLNLKQKWLNSRLLCVARRERLHLEKAII